MTALKELKFNFSCLSDQEFAQVSLGESELPCAEWKLDSVSVGNDGNKLA